MKSTKSIYFKNFLTVAATLGISFLILGVAFATFSYKVIINEKRESMSVSADEAVKVVSAYSSVWSLDGFEVRMALSSLSSTTGFHIIMCDTNGTIISCSDRQIDSVYLGETISPAVMAQISEKSEYSGITDLGGIYTESRYVVGRAVRQYDTNAVMAYLFYSGNTETMAEMWRQFSGVFAAVAMSVMMIAFIISLITTKKQAEPINEMAAAAHKFARGDFSVRVGGGEREDEIGELADAFNAMASAMERSESLRRDLIANVSHELKTPMTTITGFADGILDGTIPTERQEKYLRVISSETRRLSRLVRGMLEMSQVQSMDTKGVLKNNFDISEVICQSLLSLEKKINDKGLDVQANLPEEPIITRGDKDAITQVVYNLADNAIKFSAQGSVLKLDLWKQGNKAFVSVENTGETIDQDELPLIFDRFHKTDRSRSMDKDGVGLGLYIVKTILDNHNEDIYVTSHDGVTTFVFTMTLGQEPNVNKKDKDS
ncbi:MAG: sensor histidine kinase [Oscillospiraceae bacterium]